jgi:hypothetical protein
LLDVLAGVADHTQGREDGHQRALVEKDLQESAACRRCHLEGGLVCLDLRKHIARGHLIALAPAPRGDGAFLNCVAKLRHFNGRRHVCAFPHALPAFRG